MTVTLHNIGKRFNRDWIFRNVNLTFEAGNKYAILGPNGSGKSTLLQIIAGNLTFSEGTIDCAVNDDEFYRHVSICAPYLQLIEEMTLEEQIIFHSRFKSFYENFSAGKIIELLQLQHATQKQIKHFSSGMKQRVKLGLALFSNTSLCILDEPLTNLDAAGKNWYDEMLQNFSAHRIIIIGSNRTDEYEVANHTLMISEFK